MRCNPASNIGRGGAQKGEDITTNNDNDNSSSIPPSAKKRKEELKMCSPPDAKMIARLAEIDEQKKQAAIRELHCENPRCIVTYNDAVELFKKNFRYEDCNFLLGKETAAKDKKILHKQNQIESLVTQLDEAREVHAKEKETLELAKTEMEQKMRAQFEKEKKLLLYAASKQKSAMEQKMREQYEKEKAFLMQEKIAMEQKMRGKYEKERETLSQAATQEKTNMEQKMREQYEKERAFLIQEKISMEQRHAKEEKKLLQILNEEREAKREAQEKAEEHIHLYKTLIGSLMNMQIEINEKTAQIEMLTDENEQLKFTNRAWSDDLSLPISSNGPPSGALKIAIDDDGEEDEEDSRQPLLMEEGTHCGQKFEQCSSQQNRQHHDTSIKQEIDETYQAEQFAEESDEKLELKDEVWDEEFVKQIVANLSPSKKPPSMPDPKPESDNKEYKNSQKLDGNPKECNKQQHRSYKKSRRHSSSSPHEASTSQSTFSSSSSYTSSSLHQKHHSKTFNKTSASQNQKQQQKNSASTNVNSHYSKEEIHQLVANLEFQLLQKIKNACKITNSLSVRKVVSSFLRNACRPLELTGNDRSYVHKQLSRIARKYIYRTG